MSTRFKDLCLDVADPQAMARFWSAALGLSVEPRGPNVRLGDGVDEHVVWLNRVPEPKTVKHRVHLDVHTASVGELTALGATILDDTQRWTLMADPEGGEFCAFVRDEVPPYRLYELVVDAADPPAIAGWWAQRLGLTAEVSDEGDAVLPPGAGWPWEVVFQRVPEPKAAKNRVHWDLWGDVDELLAAGATVLRRRDDEVDWDLLADPEGNEFCVFTRR